MEAMASAPQYFYSDYTAAQNKDFTMLQSSVLVIAVVYLTASLIADLVYSLLNPRIRYGGNA